MIDETPAWSTFATNGMRLTPEGDLPTDEEQATFYRDIITSTVASGAARLLIDQSGVPIEEWHSEHEGWELDTLDSDLLAAITHVARALVTDGFHQLITFATWLAFVDRASEPTIWHHDFGRALYRAGTLLGSMLIAGGLSEHERIGFADYHHPDAYRLDDWVSESGYVGAIENLHATPTVLHADIHASLKDEADTKAGNNA
jgi:hypothetical protein